jgi:putative nucleotidyltransferase with HDIG domain
MSVAKLASQLEAILQKRIQEDQLVLPTMPAVALEVQRILDDPEAGMKEVALALEKDPVLAARSMKQASSAALAGKGPPATLAEALARLGAKTIKRLLVEAAAQRLFQSRIPKVNGQLKVLWQHSTAVGLLAREVQTIAGGTDPEGAYLSGLLHDVGKPVVATILLEVERLLSDADQRQWIDTGQWLEVVAAVHRPVGVALAESWHLPAVVVDCVKAPPDYLPEDKASVLNAVRFGNALAKQAGICAGAVDAAANDAVVVAGRAAIGLSDENLEALTKGLQERVAGLYA